MLALSKIPASKTAVSGLFTVLLVVASAFPARASKIHSEKAAINKAALGAYCEEAEEKREQLNDGRLSYKTVARLASNRAMSEHPDVYRDSNAWLARIVDLLDKYGDEPRHELCHEDPQSEPFEMPDS